MWGRSPRLLGREWMGKQGTAGHPSGEEGVEGGLLVRDLV